ncbi:MAG: PilN domain-containing protein [Phycisphaerales bacterium]|nr:MAG: PilN domain-containing protein [Phycisphaerales bacterium]
MKEIEFLPEWYKESRQRQMSVRRQYIALVSIFVVLMTWNLIATNSIAKATAELAQGRAQEANARVTSATFVELKDRVTQLQKKSQFLKKIDSRIDVAGTLAEMSALIDRRIVIRKVEFSAERFPDAQKAKPVGTAAVRVAPSRSGSDQELHLGNVRFRVLIEGVAVEASDVAALVQSLEQSSYFRTVYPSFSRNTEIKTARSPARQASDDRRSASGPAQDLQVSEFQITCLLANYNELTSNKP